MNINGTSNNILMAMWSSVLTFEFNFVQATQNKLVIDLTPTHIWSLNTTYCIYYNFTHLLKTRWIMQTAHNNLNLEKEKHELWFYLPNKYGIDIQRCMCNTIISKYGFTFTTHSLSVTIHKFENNVTRFSCSVILYNMLSLKRSLKD